MSNVKEINVGGSVFDIEDERVTNNLALMENDVTSSRSYSVGEYILRSKVLRKVIAPISPGDTLTIGTNLSSDGIRLSDEITGLHNNLTSIDVTGSTNTTGSTITKGTYFYLNGVLVIAKTDIANGATFTLGTNIEDAQVTDGFNYKSGESLSLSDGVVSTYPAFFSISSKYLYATIFLKKNIQTTPTVSFPENTTTTVHDAYGRIVHNNSTLNVSVNSAIDNRLEIFYTKKDGTAFIDSRSQTAANQSMAMVQPTINIFF